MTAGIDRLKRALGNRYGIERELGEGGMATVYLVDDLRHDRKVALKVLKPELAAVVGAERFLAEIKTTASLQHPHILPLHDSGEADGFLFYVMPYVEGESLRDRLDRERQLPVDEAVEIACKVASALDYAHEQGVVHRDVKPANVLLSERGEPLVADFGIALALSQAGGGRITETGLSLGTPHYMSPEQASGDRAVDRRTDVYALGCVLYEMLVGEPPYVGPTAQAVLGRILIGDPMPPTERRKAVPVHVEHAILKALEKLPADRFGYAEEFGKALEDEGFRHPSLAPGATGMAHRQPARGGRSPAGWGRGAWMAVAVFLALLAAWGWLRPRPHGVEGRLTRLSLDLGELESIQGDVVISPDGRRLAVSAEVEGRRAIWTRRLDEPLFRVIPGTEGGLDPALSPDGDWVVFRVQAENTLVKAPVAGGGAVTLVDDASLSPFVPHWADGGRIVFVTPQEGLHIVSETGTDLRPVASWIALGRAELLPGGNALVTSPVATTEIHYVDLEQDTSWVVVPDAGHARYAPTGHLLFVSPSSGGLFALPFDPGSGQATGGAVRVLDRVASESPFRTGYDVSEDGTLIYREGEFSGLGAALDMHLLLLDRAGGADTLRLPPQPLGRPRFSPDGGSIAYETGGNPTDLYRFDLTTGRTIPLASEGDNDSPVWSPDGTRIVFNSNRRGTEGEDLFLMPGSGEGEPTLLLSQPGPVDPTSWPSEDLIGFERALAGAAGNRDLWTVSLSGDGEARPWLEAPWSETGLQISPDGTLAAYESDESGLVQVYLRTFPDPADEWRVSRTAIPALAPRWSPDGEAIYFWVLPEDGPRTLQEARLERDGEDVRLHPPEPVLEAPAGVARTSPRAWDIHPDGDRFLVIAAAPSSSESGEGEDAGDGSEDRYVVILNWFTELERRMGEEGG